MFRSASQQEGVGPYLRDIHAAADKYLTADERDILFEASLVPYNVQHPRVREIRARYGNRERSRDVPYRVNPLPGDVYIYRLR